MTQDVAMKRAVRLLGRNGLMPTVMENAPSAAESIIRNVAKELQSCSGGRSMSDPLRDELLALRAWFVERHDKALLGYGVVTPWVYREKIREIDIALESAGEVRG